jgi:hypothetical protein
MKFIGLLLILAVIGYAMSVYLSSSNLTSASPDGSASKPKDYLDKTQQSADAINQALQKNKERLDGSN